MFTLSVWVLGPMCVSLGALVCEPWGPRLRALGPMCMCIVYEPWGPCVPALGPMCMSLGAHVCEPWGPCVCVCVCPPAISKYYCTHIQYRSICHPPDWPPRLYCMYAIQVFSFSDPCHYICIQSFIWLDPDHGSRPLNQVFKKLSYHFAFLFITLNLGNVSDRIAGPWQHYSSIVTMTTL